MKQQTYARIYRFHESIAFSTDDSAEALYLSPELAREMAALLVAFAKDIETCKFSKSNLYTQFAGDPPLQEPTP